MVTRNIPFPPPKWHASCQIGAQGKPRQHQELMWSAICDEASPHWHTARKRADDRVAGARLPESLARLRNLMEEVADNHANIARGQSPKSSDRYERAVVPIRSAYPACTTHPISPGGKRPLPDLCAGTASSGPARWHESLRFRSQLGSVAYRRAL